MPKHKIMISHAKNMIPFPSCCPTCQRTFSWNQDTNTKEPRLPREGDCGVCTGCLAWWEIKDGTVIPYKPTNEEKLQTGVL